jgi:hypothetical protein
MKKSTNESPAKPQPGDETKLLDTETYKVPLAWEMFRMEGGISLLIILPLVVLFFLKKAFETV